MSESATPFKVEDAKKILADKEKQRQSNLALLRGQKVMVLMPTIDQRVDAGLLGTLLQEQSRLNYYGIQLYFAFQADSLITRGRNFLIHNALKTDANWFMWIDSDIRFPPGAITALLAENKSIIGAGYPIKCLEPARIVRALGAGANPEHVLKYATRNVISNYTKKSIKGLNIDPIEADNLGTGFMLTHRSVYDALTPVLEHRRCLMPGVSYKTPEEVETYIPFFDCDLRQIELFPNYPKFNDYLSEDYYFCHKARDVGFKSFCLPSIQLQHVGIYVYEGDYLRSLGVVYEEEKVKDSK